MTSGLKRGQLARSYRRILPYLRPYWRLALGAVGVTILMALVSLLVPWPLKILVDSVLSDHPLPPILTYLSGAQGDNRPALLTLVVVAGVGIVLVSSGLTVLNEYIHTKLAQNISLDFRGDVFRHVQRLSVAFHNQQRAGQLVYTIKFQTEAAPDIIITVLPLAQSILTLVGMFWVCFLIDRQLALISLIVVPLLYSSVGYYTTHIQERLAQVKEMEGESLSIANEVISMLRTIVAFGREDYEYRRFRDQSRRTVTARIDVTLRQTLFSLVVEMTTALGTALVLGFGAYRALYGQLTVGQLLVVLAYVAAVYKPLSTLSTTFGALQEQLASLQLAFNLLDTVPEVEDAPSAVTLPPARGQLTFDNVHFNYRGRSGTLRGVSFSAQPGQTIAIVGPTGAGKTTLVSLLPRFYQLQRGRILIDATDIRTVTLHSLRAQISVVPQEPLLFSGTVADNIRYGRLEASMEEITAAAQAAAAHEFILGLPQQYQTSVGERGVRLSGGERQRICIARAFLKNAPILILDEPTASVDSKTEGMILDALERLMAGRTTLMVAHRLSTIRRADLIMVLDHGQLVELGTHDELLDSGGLYKQLCNAQNSQVRVKLQPVLQPAVNSTE
jgi:ATP-binding cassette, subfamily B, bacterial